MGQERGPVEGTDSDEPGAHGSFAKIVSGSIFANRSRDVEYQSSPSLDESTGTLEPDVGPELYEELVTTFLFQYPSSTSSSRTPSRARTLFGSKRWSTR